MQADTVYERWSFKAYFKLSVGARGSFFRLGCHVICLNQPHHAILANDQGLG